MSTGEEWEFFKSFPDFGPAEAMRVWLQHENVPTKIEARSLESGIEHQYCVFVAKRLAHRARWVTAQLPPTEQELEFLATGKLFGPDEKEK
jgi:hypothetical protein